MTVPWISSRCSWMSQVVIPLAYKRDHVAGQPVETPHVLGDRDRVGRREAVTGLPGRRGVRSWSRGVLLRVGSGRRRWGGRGRRRPIVARRGGAGTRS